MKPQRLAAVLAPALAAVLLVLPLAACSAGSGGSIPAVEIPTVEQRDLPAQSAPDAGSFAGEAGAADSAVEANRSVIRSGDVSIEVDDPASAAGRVTEIAKSLGGYVESETTTNGGDGAAAGAYLMLRVPADRLDDAFDALAEVGSVTSQNRSASDVTAEHVDLQARVKALEESVERLTELMSGAATTGELIEAETALSQRQQELDGLRAQLEFLEGQVDQASISVSLSSKSAIPGGPGDFWEGLGAGWHSIVTAGAGALVVFGVLLPWLVIAGIITFAIILIVRAARRGRRAPTGDGER